MRKSDDGLSGLKRLRQQAFQETGTDSPRSQGRQPGKKHRHSARRQAETLHTPPGPPTHRVAPGNPSDEAEELPITVDDAVLFKRAMRSVTPIRASGRVVLPPVPTAPGRLLRQRRQWASGSDLPAPPAISDHYVPAAAARDPTFFVKTGRGPDLIRDLKRGKWPMQASLDLHGSTLEEARTRLDRFLSSCVAHGIRSVQVVHGKGLGSKNGQSVLKQPVRLWLTQIDAVLAYVECQEIHGGAGAVQVLLRMPEKISRPGA
jgi:DNA-nicking Smr family endonuclease